LIPKGIWKNYRCLILWSAGILAFDRVTKWLIMKSFYLQESVSIIPGFFDFTYIRNRGAAFGFLAGASSALTAPFFILLSILAAVVIFFYYKKASSRELLTRTSLAWIMGGALGNFIDRLAYGEVVDFLDFHWRQLHWPAFNVADSAITLGVVGLFIGIRMWK